MEKLKNLNLGFSVQFLKYTEKLDTKVKQRGHWMCANWIMGPGGYFILRTKARPVMPIY